MVRAQRQADPHRSPEPATPCVRDVRTGGREQYQLRSGSYCSTNANSRLDSGEPMVDLNLADPKACCIGGRQTIRLRKPETAGRMTGWPAGRRKAVRQKPGPIATPDQRQRNYSCVDLRWRSPALPSDPMAVRRNLCGSATMIRTDKQSAGTFTTPLLRPRVTPDGCAKRFLAIAAPRAKLWLDRSSR
jgi:hypothetical protein